MNPVHVEQTKLTATSLNNLALAFIVAGFVAPAVAFSMRASSSPPYDVLTFCSASFGFRRSHLTFRKRISAQIGPMSLLEAYVIIVLPLLALGIAGGLYYFAR